MAIKSLRLENFQSHKDSTFEFDKGLNILVGTSHQGKTSCARALSLVLYNQWDKSWVRIGSAFCRITLIMDNGVTVIREKGEKINKYLLQVPKATPQEFVNFGIDVPEVISKVLRINKIVLDKDDSLTLNYASQLEPLFLFNRSGSQKAKVFGRLSGAHYLDHALRNLGVEKRSIIVEKNLKEKELIELQTQYANLSKIYDFAPSITRFIVADSKIEEAKGHLEALKSLFLRSKDFKRRYGMEIEKENVLSQAKAVELAPIEAFVQRLKQLKQFLLWKRDLESKNTTLNGVKQQLNQEFESITTQYLSILRDNLVCPTCFEQLNEQKMSKIQDNLIGEHKCLV